jgi:hypothetical protein
MKGGKTNIANIFDDPYKNKEFSKLSNELQYQILGLPDEQRGGVMNEIIRKSYENEKKIDPLKDAFNALPPSQQVIALQGGYSSMAKEFNNLVKKIPDPMVTIIKPKSMTEILTNQFPELGVVEQKGGNTSSSEPVTLDIEELSSENTSSSNSNGEIKIIKI